MALITEVIPEQVSLIIQKKIAEILLTEITNQHSLQGLDSDFKVYSERIEPYDNSEDVAISLALRETSEGEHTAQAAQVQNIYFIDVFAGGKETETEDLSTNVHLKLTKYVGLVRYILSSPKYLKLGMPRGIIGNRHIVKLTYDTDYSNWGNHSNYDGSGIRFCRIIYSVTAAEYTELPTGVPLEGNNTIIEVGTNKGIQLIFNG